MSQITFSDAATLIENHGKPKNIQVVAAVTFKDHNLKIFFFDHAFKYGLVKQIIGDKADYTLLTDVPNLEEMSREEMLEKGEGFLFKQEQIAAGVEPDLLEWADNIYDPEQREFIKRYDIRSNNVTCLLNGSTLPVNASFAAYTQDQIPESRLIVLETRDSKGKNPKIFFYNGVSISSFDIEEG